MNLEDKKKLLTEKVIACGLKPSIDYINLNQKIWYEYKYNIRLSVSATSYDLKFMSEDTQNLVQVLLQDKCFVMFLISIMFGKNDVDLSYRLYHQMYGESNPELTAAWQDDNFIEEYINRLKIGQDIGDMNAELWLNSVIGESYLFNHNDGDNEL